MIPNQTGLPTSFTSPKVENYQLFGSKKAPENEKKEVQNTIDSFPLSFNSEFQDLVKKSTKHIIENPEEEDEQIFGYNTLMFNIPQSQSQTFTEINNEDTDEPFYFIGQPKKKLILSYEVCSQLLHKEDFHDCLCNLDITSTPSRNIIINNINQQMFTQFLSLIRSFGDVQNLDLCKFEKEGVIIISYFNQLQSFMAFQHLKSLFAKELRQNLIQIEFLIPYNQNNFLDFLLVSNRTAFPLEFVSFFFSQFGEILNVSKVLRSFSDLRKIITKNELYIVKFYDIRTLDKIKAFLLKAKMNLDTYSQEQLLFFKNIHFFSLESQNNLFFNYHESLITSKISLQTSTFPKFNKPRAPLKLSSQEFHAEGHPKSDLFNLDLLEKNDQDTKIDLNFIAEKKDLRTTLMIRNIPNRYTQTNILDIININYRGLYDFVYMPTDNMNKCNIGYCFINFIQPKHIIKFHQEFNGKRWEVFRSEKVCTLNYGRIQGKNELIKHFKNFNKKNHQNEPLILFNTLTDAPFV